MRAILLTALIRHTRAHNLAQTIQVIALKAQTFLNLTTHTLGPRLGAKCSYSQTDIILRKAHLIERLGKIEGI